MINTSNIKDSNNSYPDFFPCTETLCSFFPLTALIPVTTVCIILLMVGSTGNIITILIIKRYKDMRTTTNFYLSSMAVSDMIILFCLPFDLYRLWRSKPWIFGDFMCKFFHFISEGCTYSTILHITALSIERYLAICFPLKAKVFITKRRVKAVIIFLWAIALLSAGPFYFLAGMEPENVTDPSKSKWECKITSYAKESGLLNIFLWVTTIYFFIPMFCLIILYGLIGRTLWTSKDRIRESDVVSKGGRNQKQAVKIWDRVLRKRKYQIRIPSAAKREGFTGKPLWKNKDRIRKPNAVNREKSHKQTLKILAVVVLAFVICWLPFHIGRIIFINVEELQMLYLSQYFNVVAMLLFYLSASINPILYNLISKKYRAAAYKLLRPDPSGERAYSITRDDMGGYTDTSASMQNDYETNI